MRMTTIEYIVGGRNMLFWAACLLLLGCMIFLVVHLAFGQSVEASLLVSFGVLLVCSTAWFWAQLVHDKRTSGGLLLDCGTNPYRRSFIRNAVLSAFGGVFYGCVGIVGNQLISPAWPDAAVMSRQLLRGTVLLVAVHLMAVPYWITLASRRLQVREQGIVSFGGVLRWHSIRSWSWEPGGVLLVQAKSSLSFPSEGVIRFPLEYKHAVEELLRQHCVIRP